MGKRRVWQGKVIIPEGLIASAAYRDLSPQGVKLLMFFYSKRIYAKAPQGGYGRTKKKKVWICKNAGHIKFSYREAKELLGWSQETFRRYKDELVEKGFLDIINPGGHAPGHAAEYAVTTDLGGKYDVQRWRLYGEPGFVKVVRPPDKRKGHELKAWHKRNREDKMSKHRPRKVKKRRVKLGGSL